jgi:rhodanese-related sulfurtransferase
MVLLDIRTPEEWQKSGVPEGAWPVNMYDPEFGKALQAVFAANQDKRIGMICAVGGRTGYVEGVLRKNGFPEIVNVGEGMFGSQHGKGWIKRGLPVVSATEAKRAMPTDYRAK